MKKRAILGIDLQNDFVLINGALSVNGAEEDAKRIGAFISNNKKDIHHISLTLDSHHPLHIANPIYWKDKDGNHPSPFTVITYQDIKDGKWTTSINPQWSFRYVEELEKQGSQLTIWNPHCVLGTDGWAIVSSVIKACIEWEETNCKPYNLWFKGSNWFTEHYSIFKAAVTYPGAPETDLNQQLIQVLNEYDEVFLVGEAADFCVANSLKDIVTYAPELAKKIIVLEDCISWIILNNPSAIKIYEDAKNAGVKFAKSTDNLF